METDHKPLVPIMLKPLNKAPSRLQRMLLKSQKYNLNVNYKQGKYMFVVHAFVYAHLPTVNTCEFVYSLSLSTDQLLQVKYASRNDQALQQLHEIHKKRWLLSKSDVAECL